MKKIILIITIVIILSLFSLERTYAQENESCIVNWICGYWSECKEGYQTVSCEDINKCDKLNLEYSKRQICNSNYEIDKIPQEPNILVYNGSKITFIASFKNDDKKDYSFYWYINELLVFEDKGSASIFRESFFNNSIVRVKVSDINFEGNIFWFVNISGQNNNCQESWQCKWSECNNYISNAYDCIDENSCGTIYEKPIIKECDCISDLKCSSWSSCEADYDIINILGNKLITSGKMKRICSDIKNCINNSIDYQDCSLSKEIYTKKINDCGEEYIQIYDKENDKLVSTVNKNDFNDSNKIDILFNANEAKTLCNYCFDGIKNFDEEEIDCGGEKCPQCINNKYKDNLLIYKIFSFLILAILCIILFFVNNKKFSQKFNELKFKVRKNKGENKYLNSDRSIKNNIFDLRKYLGKT